MTSAHTNVVTSLPRFLPPNDIMCLYISENNMKDLIRLPVPVTANDQIHNIPFYVQCVTLTLVGLWCPLLYLVGTWLNDCSPVGTYIHSHANDLESRCVSWINAPPPAQLAYIQIILSQHIKYLVVMQGSYHIQRWQMTIFRSVTAAHNSIGTRTYWWMIST